MEEILSLSEAKIKLNRMVDHVLSQEDEFIITKNGAPAAVLVPMSLYEAWKETQIIKSDPEFFKDIKKGIARLRRGGKRYSFEDIFGEAL